MSEEPFPGSAADFYEQIQALKNIIENKDEYIKDKKAENAELRKLVITAYGAGWHGAYSLHCREGEGEVFPLAWEKFAAQHPVLEGEK